MCDWNSSAKTAAAAKGEFIFETKADPFIKDQYFRLCRSACRVPEAVEYLKIEEGYNNDGVILTVRRGDECVGGARLTMKRADQLHSLPMETTKFRLGDHFPELKEEGRTYCELSRLALQPEFRFGLLTRKMLERLYDIAVAENAKTMFAAAPLENARHFKKLACGMGLTESKIHDDIAVPAYPNFENVKDYLLRIELRKSSADGVSVRRARSVARRETPSGYISMGGSDPSHRIDPKEEPQRPY